MQSSNVLTIDLSTITHNLKKLHAAFGNVMLMVKANAYGTDPFFFAKFLKAYDWVGVPFLGVSHIWEGVRLREAGIEHPIFVLSSPPYEAEKVTEYRLTPSISTLQEVEALEKAAKKHGCLLSTHLHINTGMNRLGCHPHEALMMYQTIHRSGNLQLEGVMTHFVAAENSAFDPFTLEQIRIFKECIDSLPTPPKWIHAANSEGSIRFPISFCNLVRIGLGVLGYGVCLDGVKPALTLSTLLAGIQACEEGETVSYHRTFTIKRQHARIGVVPFGYYDGFPRSLSGKGYVLIRGKKAPMIGTICMDFMMVDLTDIPEAQVGDEVILFGPQLSAETVAAWAQTDVRELLVSLSERVQRLWINPPPMLRTEHDTAIECKLPDSLFPF